MSLVALERVPQGRQPTKGRYHAPTRIDTILLKELLVRTGRGALQEKQLDFLRSDADASEAVHIYYTGDSDLLCRTAVSIVGTRDVSDDGRARARRLARELSDADVV